VNAGTAEFLVSPDGEFFFLEVNTRLQVEHPVTEAVTGLDLVALQFRAAAGEKLAFTQDAVRRAGSAIELRVTAEDARAGFVPSTGRVALLRLPTGPGVRVDHALFDGMTVPTEYDPLLAKIVVWGKDRAEALARAKRAVRETIVAGLATSLSFHAHALADPDFAAGRYDTGYVAAHWPPTDEPALDDDALIAGALGAVLARRAAAARVQSDGAGLSQFARAAREDALR
jgi:acetyl/propionyl-CoA carboxylase alpha subunit